LAALQSGHCQLVGASLAVALVPAFSYRHVESLDPAEDGYIRQP
jgi:hypothetical protein